MTIEAEEGHEFDEYADEQVGCVHCSYDAWVIVCPDDMCRGEYDGGPWAPCGSSKCVRPCRHCNPNGTEGF
jgi:hypothetical protein